MKFKRENIFLHRTAIFLFCDSLLSATVTIFFITELKNGKFSTREIKGK